MVPIRRQERECVDRIFRRGQFFSAALYSIGHGGNDAQKTMGIIFVVLMTAEACAARIVAAMESRRRLAILSLRGRLGRFVRLVAPGLIDRIAARAVRRGR
jgi:phosphate/sulfate permease